MTKGPAVAGPFLVASCRQARPTSGDNRPMGGGAHRSGAGSASVDPR